jgi:hypothetical protein
MILHQNSIILLDYNPATDILQVDYPDLNSLHLSEIRHSLKLLVEAVIGYDVKKLLLDASNTATNLSVEDNKNLSLELAADLAKTRLQKLARIQPNVQLSEVIAQQNIRQIKLAGLMSYQLQTFTSRPEAIEWLKR